MHAYIMYRAYMHACIYVSMYATQVIAYKDKHTHARACEHTHTQYICTCIHRYMHASIDT